MEGRLLAEVSVVEEVVTFRDAVNFDGDLLSSQFRNASFSHSRRIPSLLSPALRLKQDGENESSR